MITATIPNQASVTVESGPNSKGPGFVVSAKAWSLDLTAVIDQRWVRYDTSAEADVVAKKLAEADWRTIGRWYANA